MCFARCTWSSAPCVPLEYFRIWRRNYWIDNTLSAVFASEQFLFGRPKPKLVWTFVDLAENKSNWRTFVTVSKQDCDEEKEILIFQESGIQHGRHHLPLSRHCSVAWCWNVNSELGSNLCLDSASYKGTFSEVSTVANTKDSCDMCSEHHFYQTIYGALDTPMPYCNN